jgi:ceramide glucosyltransferase
MMQNVEFFAALALWTIAFGWQVFTMVFAVLQPAKRRRTSLPSARKPVSIIVPTCAEDSSLRAQDRAAAIASLLALELPASEIILCVDRGGDRSPLATRLREQYGRVPSVRVIAADAQSSANPKIDAMAAGSAAAHNRILLFSDDNILVDPSHVSNLLAQLNGDVGLVSAAAIGVKAENFGGELELAFMNGQFARLHLAGDFLGFSGVLGKTIMVRQSDLARLGGLYPLGGDCCEDAALTRIFISGGLQAALSEYPVYRPVRRQKVVDVVRRHLRWMTCRRRHLPILFLCEAIFSTPVACLSGAFLLDDLVHAPVAGVLLTAGLWCTLESLLHAFKGWDWSVRTPFAWLAREALFLPLWGWAFFARSVNWYGRRVPVVASQSVRN